MSNPLGPSAIVEPIIGPRAFGGLLASVDVVEPDLEAQKAVDNALDALKAAQEKLAEQPKMNDDGYTDGTGAIESAEAAVERAEAALSKALLQQANSRRWENGYTYRPLGGCAEANVWANCSGEMKEVDPTSPLVAAFPFTVYAGFTCSTWGMEEEERIAHAQVRLGARESQAIENELWHGTLAAAEGWTTNPVLAGSATTALTTGSETSPLPYALASIQQALRECLGSDVAGTIHASAKAASLWMATYQIFREPDGIIRDLMGNVIVVGAGYDGSSPIGVVDPTGRTEWVYGTGPVRVFVGPVYLNPTETKEAVERSTNDITWRAERSASPHFDPCCLYGINVDLCSTTCSASGS